VRRIDFTSASRAQFFAYFDSYDKQVAAVERLLVLAKNPEKALALVGAQTRIRRANIGGFCFFLLPIESSKNFPTPVLLVIKIRSI
jgi:hypothetical protein